MLYRPYTPDLTPQSDDTPAQDRLQLYDGAKSTARKELQKLYAAMALDSPDKAAIFQAQTDILDDVVMDEEIQTLLKAEPLSPGSAVAQVFTMYVNILSQAEDALIRERTADLQDVRNRVMRILAGQPEANLAHLDEPCIVFAHDLLPSDTASLRREKVLGIVCETGGLTSHTAIIARGYGIPALLGLRGALDIVTSAEQVIIDACEGILITGASPDILTQYEEKRKYYLQQVALTHQYFEQPAITTDGISIEVGVNIASTEHDDLQRLATSADSVGLFRTEFLFMEGRRLPNEETQLKAYQNVLTAFGHKPVILRTLDIGGDKEVEALHLEKEANPFLGNRALRLCFSQPDLLRTQLRAAYRASVHGNLWIMLPMVGSMDDIHRAKGIIQAVKAELDAEHCPYSPDVKVGVMVEIPALAVIADLVAQEVDFASIGTNDLCQYALAVDRMNEIVAPYYQSYHPAMFRLIQYTIEQFTLQGKPVSICGEMGSDPSAAAVLIGMGLRKVSTNPDALPYIKKLICTHSMEDFRSSANEIRHITHADEIKSYLNSQYT